MPKILQWGKRWDPSLPYTADLRCPCCGWSPESNDNFAPHTVGFDDNGPKSRYSDRTTQIIECPKDYTQFWFHNDRGMFEIYKRMLPEKFNESKIKPEGSEAKRK